MQLTISDGFILSENKDDNTKLDHLITPMLSKAQTTLLEDHRYLGDYTLDATGVCYRTQVALRSTFTPARKMERFLAGTWDGEKDDAKVDAKRTSVLQHFKEEIEAKLSELHDLEASIPVSALIMRWRQILAMVETVLTT
jgi:hypothetical protein